MATVIDALIVTLGLDASGMKTGQKDAERSLKGTEDQAARTAKEMEARGKQAAQFFSKIRNEVLALTAAFVGANSLKHFAEHLTQSDAALGRLAHNVGMTTEDLSAWEGAAERAGGSSAGMAGSIRSLVGQIQQLKTTGNASFVRPLALAHVDMARFISDATPVGEKLLMLADAFRGMDAAKAQYLGSGMGLDEGTINLLMEGRGAVEAYLLKQKEMNAVHQKDAELAIARQNAWRDMGDTLEGVGRTILTDVSPAIVDLLQRMQQWLETNKAWIESDIEGGIRRFAEWLKNIDWDAVEKGLASFVTGAREAADAVGGWVKIGEILFGLWIGSKFLAVLANVAKLKVAFLGAGGAGGGLIATLSKLGLYGAAADLAVTAVDPGDKLGTWIDNNIPGASWLDNQASKIGLGRSYEEQAKASAGGYKESSGDIARLTSLGWSREQAIGIAANVFAESSGETNKVGDHGEAYGLVQWHKPRQEDFAKWAGHDIRQSTRDEQLRFLDYELRHGSERAAGQALAGAKTAAEAAAIMVRRYERPKDIEGDTRKRVSIANGMAGGVPSAPDAQPVRQPAVPPSINVLAPGPRPDPALLTGASAGATSYIANNAMTNTANHSQTEVNVGQVTVQSQATDAKGIARDFGQAIRDQFALSSQVNYGLT